MNNRPEQMLLDLARRLVRSGGNGYVALYCNMARLRPYHRDIGHRRLAARILQPLADAYSGNLLRFFSGDLLLLAEDLPEKKRLEAAKRLFSLFGDDPIVANERTRMRFLRVYEIGQEAESFLALAQQLFDARTAHDEAQKNLARVTEDEGPPPEPMDASGLVKVETALKNSDVGGLITRQAVCALSENLPPQPTFDEIFVSVHRLQSAVLPGTSLTANTWLFQDLTRLLDQRLLATLAHSRDSRLRESFSLNLNIETLTSEKFLSFDAAHGQHRSQSILVELQMIDVLANLHELQKTMPFLEDRRYRLCLDGISHRTLLSLSSPRSLGFDFVKLLWSPDIADLYRAEKLGPLRDAIQAIGPERVILCHCDSEDAIEIGMTVGMKLFQGYHIDVLRAAGLSISAARKDSDQPLQALA